MPEFEAPLLQKIAKVMVPLDSKNATQRCRSILIVEDEPTIRENLQLLLEFEGYLVYTAADGAAGLRLLHTIPRPCVILLDMMMPVMDGREFIGAKSQDDAIASIPVCIVSGVADKPDLQGVQGFVKKPIDFDCLLKFISQFCTAPQTQTPVANVGGD